MRRSSRIGLSPRQSATPSASPVGWLAAITTRPFAGSLDAPSVRTCIAISSAAKSMIAAPRQTLHTIDPGLGLVIAESGIEQATRQPAAERATQQCRRPLLDQLVDDVAHGAIAGPSSCAGCTAMADPNDDKPARCRLAAHWPRPSLAPSVRSAPRRRSRSSCGRARHTSPPAPRRARPGRSAPAPPWTAPRRRH